MAKPSLAWKRGRQWFIAAVDAPYTVSHAVVASRADPRLRDRYTAWRLSTPPRSTR